MALAPVCNNDMHINNIFTLLIASIYFTAMGVVPSPIDCYMVNRSLKTLALRMEQHKKSSLSIAKWLEKHPKVVEVLHPGTYNLILTYTSLYSDIRLLFSKVLMK